MYDSYQSRIFGFNQIDKIFNSRDGMIDKYNVENVEGDDKFVEMDVALVKVNTFKTSAPIGAFECVMSFPL